MFAKFQADSIFRSKVIRGVPKFRILVTWPRPRQIWGQFGLHSQEGSVLHMYAKFEADNIIRSKVIRGSQNFEFWDWEPHFLEGVASTPLSDASLHYLCMYIYTMTTTPSWGDIL